MAVALADNTTIGAVLDHYAKERPDAIAMASGDRTISYEAFRSLVEQTAGALRQSGVSKGDRVFVLSPPDPDVFITFLAALKIGAIWGALNPRYKFPELLQIIRDAEPRLIFVNASMNATSKSWDADRLAHETTFEFEVVEFDPHRDASSGTGLSDWLDSHGDGPASSADEATDPQHDPAIIIYTSGTTGRPKGALLSQYSVLRHAYRQRELLNGQTMRSLNAYPANHLSGIVGNVSPLVSGGYIRFLERFDPDEVLTLIARDRITFWGGVPTMLSLGLERYDPTVHDLSSVETINWSGGSASRQLVEELLKITPRLTTMYAMTETGGAVTMVPPCSDVYKLTETVGTPLSDCEVRLVAEDGSDVPAGEVGEIWVRGMFIFLAYWKDPVATAASFDASNWFSTGDLGRFDLGGNLILVGRSKDFYKSGGYNVYPKEIETVLDTHPEVRMSAVVGVSHPLYGEVGTAYVRTKDGSTVSDTAILDFCQDRLARYKIPGTIVFVAEFPTLPNGKVDKLTLRDMAKLEAAP